MFDNIVDQIAHIRKTNHHGGWSEELKNICDVFWSLLCSAEPDKKEIQQHIVGILLESGINSKDTKFKKVFGSIARAYKKLSAFLKTNITFVERTKDKDNGIITEKKVSLSFGEYLEEIKGKHVHQGVVNGEGKTCSCSYHEEELFYHLLLAGLLSGLHAKSIGSNIFHVIVAAMLHDIGKVSTVSTTDAGYIAYPFHGEMGALILSGIYSADLAPYFTKDAWETMMRTISIHMCSYHITSFDSYWDTQRVNSTRNESYATKLLLYSLSFGDTLAAFSNKSDFLCWLNSRDKWWESINQPFKLYKKLKKSKVLVIIRGFSNSGKSTIAEIIAKNLSDSCVPSRIISRDMIMAQQSGYSGSSRPTGKEYQLLHTAYSDEKAGKAVNTAMRKEISKTVKDNEVKVIIIDTVASMFPGFEGGILPANIGNCEVIAIDVNANVMTNDDALTKNGLDKQVQMALSGIRDRFAPLDTKKLDLHNMASKYTFANSPSRISNPSFVFQIGWNESFYGENSIGLNPALTTILNLACRFQDRKIIEGTDSMQLVDYVNLIFEQSGRSFTALMNHFKMLGYHSGTPSQLVGTIFEFLFFNIKYLEHNNNWCIWGCQARGTSFYYDSDSGKWVLCKFLMLRGAEMLTILHKKNNINSNENVTDGKIDHLSQDQQNLYRELANPSGKPQLMVSFKKDGSLFSVILYTGKMAKIMRPVINAACAASGDTFNKTVMETYDATIGHKNSVLIFQTQSTLMMTKEMYDYTTTALFDRQEGFNPKLSPENKIIEHGPQFFMQISKLFDSLPAKGHIKQILFETICANRTESFSEKVHNELAVSYNTSSYTVISATVINSGENLSNGSYHTVFPHFMFSEKIHATGFNEPAFWNVTKSEDMSAMLALLDEVSWGRLSVAEFFATYQPANVFNNYEKIVDPEGFVIYDLLRGLSYGKIKSILYYIAHKFREENVPMLLALITANPNTSFPLAVLIRDTIAPMNNILLDVMDKFNSVLSELLPGLPPKILAAYNKSKKPQILLSDALTKSKFIDLAIPIIATAFPKLNDTIPNLLENEIPATAVKGKKVSKAKKPTKIELEDSIYTLATFCGGNNLLTNTIDFQDKRFIDWRSAFTTLLVK